MRFSPCQSCGINISTCAGSIAASFIRFWSSSKHFTGRALLTSSTTLTESVLGSQDLTVRPSCLIRSLCLRKVATSSLSGPTMACSCSVSRKNSKTSEPSFSFRFASAIFDAGPLRTIFSIATEGSSLKLTQRFGLVDLAIVIIPLETENSSSRARSAHIQIKTVMRTTTTILP